MKTKKPVEISNEEWRKKLTEEQYIVCRLKGTEMPFTGEYVNTKDNGVYKCVCCRIELFSSRDKFDSGTGWPSFTKPMKKSNVEQHDDICHGMHRTEATCRKCGVHLGHVFDDGPKPEGKRYCINSVSLKFQRKNKGK